MGNEKKIDTTSTNAALTWRDPANAGKATAAAEVGMSKEQDMPRFEIVADARGLAGGINGLSTLKHLVEFLKVQSETDPLAKRAYGKLEEILDTEHKPTGSKLRQLMPTLSRKEVVKVLKETGADRLVADINSIYKNKSDSDRIQVESSKYIGDKIYKSLSNIDDRYLDKSVLEIKRDNDGNPIYDSLGGYIYKNPAGIALHVAAINNGFNENGRKDSSWTIEDRLKRSYKNSGSRISDLQGVLDLALYDPSTAMFNEEGSGKNQHIERTRKALNAARDTFDNKYKGLNIDSMADSTAEEARRIEEDTNAIQMYRKIHPKAFDESIDPSHTGSPKKIDRNDIYTELLLGGNDDAAGLQIGGIDMMSAYDEFNKLNTADALADLYFNNSDNEEPDIERDPASIGGPERDPAANTYYDNIGSTPESKAEAVIEAYSAKIEEDKKLGEIKKNRLSVLKKLMKSGSLGAGDVLTTTANTINQDRAAMFGTPQRNYSSGSDVGIGEIVAMQGQEDKSYARERMDSLEGKRQAQNLLLQHRLKLERDRRKAQRDAILRGASARAQELARVEDMQGARAETFRALKQLKELAK